MNTDQALTRDPVQAAQTLALLQEKDQDGTSCRYPLCPNPRQNGGNGRPSVYCDDANHNAVNNFRLRQQLMKAAASIIPETATPKRDASHTPVTAPAESLRNSIINQITLLQNNLERYLTSLAELADPDVSAAQIRAALDQAEARIAEAQQTASAERSLRLAAESARMAAETETQTAQEAAEQAIAQMEVVEARIQQLEEQTRQQIANLQAEHETAMQQFRLEAQQRQETIERQAKETVAKAQAETVQAQEETKQANTQASEARVQANTAQRLLQETQTSLEQERREVERLRQERSDILADARARAEADRADTQRVLAWEQSERERLQKELAAAHTRADQLATMNDELRTQLVHNQSQASEKEPTSRQKGSRA